MRVLTWNIRLAVESSLARIAAVLAGAEPDIVALQEVGCGWVMGPPGDQVARIAALAGLPHHRFFPALWTEPDRGLAGLASRLHPLEQALAAGLDLERVPRYGVALLSRFPLSEVRAAPLPRARDEPRVLGRATLQSPAGPVRVLVTHLSVNAPERAHQLRDIACELEAEARPALLLGDINEPPDAASLAPLRRVARDLGEDAEGNEGWTYPSDLPARRIDYIFAKGNWRTLAPARPLPDAGSDHLPVLAVIEPD